MEKSEAYVQMIAALIFLVAIVAAVVLGALIWLRRTRAITPTSASTAEAVPSTQVTRVYTDPSPSATQSRDELELKYKQALAEGDEVGYNAKKLQMLSDLSEQIKAEQRATLEASVKKAEDAAKLTADADAASRAAADKLKVSLAALDGTGTTTEKFEAPELGSYEGPELAAV